MRELVILGALVVALGGCPGNASNAPGDGAQLPDAAPGDDAPVLDAAPGADAQPAVATVTVAPTASEIVPGAAVQLTAETRDGNGTVLTDRVVMWTSSDIVVADVSAAGLVSAVNPGGPVTITATSEGHTGTALVTVLDAPMAPVATVTVTPSLPPVIVGVSTPMTAELRDADGNLLTGRTVTWTSSDPVVVEVSSGGVITADEPGGPITITASSENQQGSVSVTTVEGIATEIRNIRDFLDTCPTNDPAYATIRQDFVLRENGQLLGDVSCVEPYSTTPTAQLTDELIALQVLRTAYHMSNGTEGRLPWTTKPLYDWMHTNVAGINLKTAPGNPYCCDVIDGRYYISVPRQDDFQRDLKRAWMGISGSLTLYAHEIRHADPGAPGHVTGCAAFPLPTDPAGCDASYDLSNLGAFGVQFWLNEAWAIGYLDVGFYCAPPEDVAQYFEWHINSTSVGRNRFVENVPPPVTARITFGGSCP